MNGKLNFNCIRCYGMHCFLIKKFVKHGLPNSHTHNSFKLIFSNIFQVTNFFNLVLHDLFYYDYGHQIFETM